MPTHFWDVLLTFGQFVRVVFPPPARARTTVNYGKIVATRLVAYVL